jgi:serine/threonine-protein kinase
VAVNESPQDNPPPSRVSPPSERLLGVVVGDRYVLRREAGRGGVAAVYVADHLFTGRTVAIKMLLPDLAHRNDARARLLREARNLGRVDHGNVVELLDAGVTATGPYVVMERLRGRSLEGLVAARGRLTMHDALRIARFAGEALAAVHSVGIVHCDIKPGNMFVVRRGDGAKSMKLIDFGVSRAPDDVQEATISGTPEYMAPEQLAAGTIGPPADIYGLGVSLYECLTGCVPFTGSLESVVARVMTQAPSPILDARPDVPRPLAQLVEVCLARDPVDRFHDGAAFLRALNAAEADIDTGKAGDTLPPEPDPHADDPRRTVARAAYGAPAELWVGDRVVVARVEDVSEKGLLVISSEVLQSGTEFIVRFPLPGQGHIVACNARIQWARTRDAGRSAMGLELVSVADEVKTAMHDYVQSAAERG